LVAGIVVGWALGTEVMIRLPPIAQRQPPSGPAPSTREASSQAAPASAPTGRAFWGSFATRLLIFGVVVGLVGILAVLVSR